MALPEASILAHWARLSEKLAAADIALGPLIRDIGPPVVRFQPDPFRALCEAILSQQLQSRAASAIIERVAAIAPPFPGPEAMAGLPVERLRKAGVSGAKAGYLHGVARRWLEPDWTDEWSAMSDAAVTARLRELKGVGEWTAHMFLIFCLGRPDVLPVGDFGVRRGVQLLRGLPELPFPREVAAHAVPWQGACSVAAWYLWRALERGLLPVALR